MPPRLTARLDPQLRARLGDLVPLAYAAGGDPAADVPAHVRAASAIRRSGARLVIVQDDVNVLATHGEATGTGALLLPLGAGGRRQFGDEIGNKQAKMDLEACAALPDGRLVAFGSGSTSARERLVILEPDGATRLLDAAAFYAGLRAAHAFSGSELNVEGALATGDALWLIQRGNGAPRGALEPVNAIATLPLDDFVRWLDGGGRPPALTGIVQFDLGGVGGARFGFTDAAWLGDGRIGFVACAEDSPDAVRDGPILGCRFGVAGPEEVRVCDVLDEQGRPSELKLEGIETAAGARQPDRLFDVVADMDRPEQPALLGRLRVTGI